MNLHPIVTVSTENRPNVGRVVTIATLVPVTNDYDRNVVEVLRDFRVTDEYFCMEAFEFQFMDTYLIAYSYGVSQTAAIVTSNPDITFAVDVGSACDFVIDKFSHALYAVVDRAVSMLN